MKKKIGELTLNEVADICKKCAEKELDDCPFVNIVLVDCGFYDDNDKRNGLNNEIEVEE